MALSFPLLEICGAPCGCDQVTLFEFPLATTNPMLSDLIRFWLPLIVTSPSLPESMSLQLFPFKTIELPLQFPVIV